MTRKQKRSKLFLISKIQILKANHNVDNKEYYVVEVVPNIKDTDFESKSQLFCLSLNCLIGCS